jgi:long-chain acyl-CoA synthetase
MLYKPVSLLIKDRIAEYKDKNALGYRSNDQKWKFVSWNEMGEEIDSIAKFLIDNGVDEFENVGIFSSNYIEWTIADLAILSCRAVVVPIHFTSPPQSIDYILKETEIKVIFVGEQDLYDKLLKLKEQKGLDLKIIVFDKTIKLNNDFTFHYNAALEAGRKSTSDNLLTERLSKVNENDTLTIIYTSGTTGEPKGVVLTNKNLMNSMRIHDLYLNVTDKYVSLAILPLSHVFERAWTFYCLHRGITNHYLHYPRIIEAMKEVMPDTMCSVPRFFEKVYTTMHDSINKSSKIKQILFHWSVKIGKRELECKIQKKPVDPLLKLKHNIADKLVLSKLRAAFGGNIKFMPCSGAMLQDEINIFFHAIGLNIKYAYGLTETFATVAGFTDTDIKFGTTGKCLPEVEVKISGDGEILVKGETVFKGYYKKPEDNLVAFEDGWFRTGDLGDFDGEGNLIMKERIKDLIKLSSGLYVSPQHLENDFSNDSLIEQIIVIGDNKNFLSALIVPDFIKLEELAKEKNINYSSIYDLINNKEIQALFKDKIKMVQKENPEYLKIKKIRLLPEKLGIETGEMTPTLKVKRNIISEKYRDLISEMY